MRFFLFLPLLLVSCAREGESSPEPEPVPEVRPEPAPREKSLEAPVAKKSGAGKVTFAGLSPEQLNEIRVIPESGRKLATPVNRTYPQVDGFWWEGQPGKWFKIPDYSEAWVGGNPPPGFVTLPVTGGLTVAVRTIGIPAWARLAMGKVGEPGWYPDAGTTRSPVPSPWRP